MLILCGWWMIMVAAESGRAVKQESEKPTEKAPVLAEQEVTYEYDDRLVVMLMGDPQLPMTDESEANVKKAMLDINQIKYDYMAVLGDLIQPVGSHANKVARYNMYSELVLRTARKPVFSISGNADCGVGLDFYHQVTGLPDELAQRPPVVTLADGQHTHRHGKWLSRRTYNIQMCRSIIMHAF